MFLALFAIWICMCLIDLFSYSGSIEFLGMLFFWILVIAGIGSVFINIIEAAEKSGNTGYYIAGVAVIILVLIYLYNRNKRNKSNDKETENKENLIEGKQIDNACDDEGKNHEESSITTQKENLVMAGRRKKENPSLAGIFIVCEPKKGATSIIPIILTKMSINF